MMDFPCLFGMPWLIISTDGKLILYYFMLMCDNMTKNDLALVQFSEKVLFSTIVVGFFIIIILITRYIEKKEEQSNKIWKTKRRVSL